MNQFHMIGGGVAYHRVVRAGLLCLAFVCSLLLSPEAASAQSSEPFAIGEKWVSVDEFAVRDVEQEEAVDEDAASVVAEAPAPKAEPAPAVPERPLNLPTLPTITTTHNVTVASTTDDSEDTAFDKRTLFSDFSNMRKVDEAYEEIEQQVTAENLIRVLGRDPFKIRFAGLPSSSVKSTAASRITRPMLEREAAAKAAQLKDGLPVKAPEKKLAAKVDVEKQKETNKACEVYAEHRRRQLEAIESDRQTLSALQSALADLGLVNELSFMTKPESALSQQGQTTSASNEKGVDAKGAIKTP